MARVFRQQIDEGILERAATLFARYGFSQTSVQAVADAVGMSKAGLLHYFPTKDALHDAVVARSAALAREVFEEVAAEPVGAARDRRVIETLVDQAIARPGMVAYLVGSVGVGSAEAGSVGGGSRGAGARGAGARGAGSPGADSPGAGSAGAGSGGAAPALDGGRISVAVFDAFGVDPAVDPERMIRVLGALGALSMLVLAAHRAGKAMAWRSAMIATSTDALGHSEAR